MKKRVLSLLVSILLLVTMLPRLELPAAAEEIASGTCGKYVNWSLSDTGVLTITGTGSMADYSSASDVPWYSQRASIKEVTIGYGVTDIGYKVFCNCSDLTSVTIAETVTRMDGYAFYRCTALTDIVIPDSVTFIGDNGFYGCSSLKSITFRGTAPSIGDACFTGVTAKSYYPCDDATWTKTAKANYGGTLTWEENHSYVDGVCSGCLLDREATVVDSGSCGTDLRWRLNSKGVLTITGTGAMKSYSAPNMPWYDKNLAIRTVVIGEGVTTIGGSAFYGCAYLTRVVLPESLTTIEWGAFTNCTRLPDVTIPAGVTNISSDVFQYCKSLNTIVFLGSAPSMKYAFRNMKATAYHPCNDKTWTDSAKAVDGNTLTWVGHVFGDYVMEQEATCTANAIAMGTCPVCQTTGQVAVPGSIAEHSYDVAETCVNCAQTRRRIVVNMEDYGYGYGWDGACIKIYADGVFVTNATVEDMNYYNRVVIPYIPCVRYTFKWSHDSKNTYPPFNIVLGDKVFSRPLLENGKVFCTIERQKEHRYQVYNTDPTCTGEGILGNVCLSCNRMETVDTVPATGHSYADGVCTVCQLSQDKEIVKSGTCGTGLQWQLDNEGTLTISGEGSMKNYYSAPELPPWSNYTIKKVVIGAGVTKLGSYALYDCTELSTVIFQGSALTAGYRSFYNVKAKGYYPCSDTTWTETAKAELSGISHWEPLHDWDEDGICKDCKHGPRLIIDMTAPDGTGWGDASMEVYKNGTPITTATFGDGYSYRRAIDCAPGATYTFRWKKGTGSGSYGFAISRMGQVLVSGNGEELTDGEVVYTLENPCTHHYEQVTIPATCTKDGSVTDACIYCGDGTTTILPATGHSYKNGLCTVCKYYDSNSCGDNLQWKLDEDGTLTITGTGPMINFDDPSKAPWYSERSTIKAVFIGDGVTSIGSRAFQDCGNLTEVTISESVTTIWNAAFYLCSGLTNVTIPKGVTDIEGYAFKDCTGLTTVTFLGTAPYIDSTVFRNVTAAGHYPCGDETWADSMNNYGGKLTWEPDHRYENGVCTFCGDRTVLPGDLDGDGERTVVDVSRLYAHTKGTLPLDGDALTRADVNGDGSVDIADTARLYAHVKGTNPLN